jgi:DNA-binding NarL/FixJ family response regulator
MPLRIVLADDAPAVLQRVKVFLESEGFQVVGAGMDGGEAVHLTRTLAPDLAILDLSMPVLSGLDAAIQIQELRPGTPVILLTMHNHVAHIIKALQMGILGYVVKTDISEDLVRAIREVCHGQIYLSVSASRAVVAAYQSQTKLSGRLATVPAAASAAPLR